MTCDWVKDHLQDYIDHGLEPSQNEIVADHLDSCDRCRYEYEGLVAAWKALDLWADLTPPGRMKQNILGSIRRRRAIPWSSLLAPAAAVLLFVVGSFLYYTGTQTKTPYQLTVDKKNERVQPQTALTAEHEADIIADLQLLRENDFYDSLDRLEKIDFLPLLDDQPEDDEGQQRSLLELLAV